MTPKIDTIVPGSIKPSIIIDGNGPDLNIIAGSTTLSGAGRTDRVAELDETFRIAEAAANAAEAAADRQ